MSTRSPPCQGLFSPKPHKNGVWELEGHLAVLVDNPGQPIVRLLFSSVNLPCGRSPGGVLRNGCTSRSSLPNHARARKILPIWRKEARADHIYRVAAEIMCHKGYEATSMNDIADAVGLTKPGLYHYIRGKEDLLFQIMNYAMDVVDQNVMVPAREIAGAEERLRTILERHAKTLLEGVSAVTTLLEETWALTPSHRRIIRGRERAYFDLMRRTLEQLATEGKLREVSPVVAAFSLFGTMLWIARWYRRDGKLKPEEALQDILQIAMNSVLRAENKPIQKMDTRG